MSTTLLDEFTRDELDHGARQALQEAMMRGPDGRKLRDELFFNRFNVLLDFEQGTATIEDDLDVSPAGTVEISIAELQRLLDTESGLPT